MYLPKGKTKKKTDINSHPHQLRHYFAEERRKEGWDLNDIRFALGHKKVETTIKYLGENNVLFGKLNDALSGRLFCADFRTLQMCQSL